MRLTYLWSDVLQRSHELPLPLRLLPGDLLPLGLHLGQLLVCLQVQGDPSTAPVGQGLSGHPAFGSPPGHGLHQGLVCRQLLLKFLNRREKNYEKVYIKILDTFDVYSAKMFHILMIIYFKNYKVKIGLCMSLDGNKFETNTCMHSSNRKCTRVLSTFKFPAK